MRTRFSRAVMVVALACVCLTSVAVAQETASEFNRNEWQRRSSGGGNVFGGPKSSVPTARRQDVARRQAEPSRPAPPRDFFSALFGGGFQSGGSSYGSSYEDSRARILITPGAGGETGNGGLGHSGSGTMAFCVRSCDGRYFPLQGRPSGPGDPNAIAQCAAFCPAAKTEVFVSYSKEAGIDGAVDKSGKSYSDIPNAFTFRQRLVENCTCNSNGQPVGIGRIDVTDDPTLKAGDVVMTADGARVFSGKRSRPPFRDGDFVTPQRFPGLPKSLRQRIAELTVL